MSLRLAHVALFPDWLLADAAATRVAILSLQPPQLVMGPFRQLP